MINIILPSTINPYTKLKIKHHFPLLRMGELVHNVSYIARDIYESNLQEKFRIIIIDSSPNIDYFKKSFEVIKSLNEKNINIKYFYLDNHLTEEDYLKGQGWCECKSIHHAYQKYPKEDFLKISSRYIYSNLNEILHQVIYSNSTVCTNNIFRKLTYSSIIFFRYYIWEEFLKSKEYLKMNDSNNMYMEHSLYAFLKNNKTKPFKKLPQLINICRSGHTNKRSQYSLLSIIRNNLYPIVTNRHSKIIKKIFN